MAPTKTGAKAGEENSLRNSSAKNLSLRGEGCPLSPPAASAPNYCGGDGGRLMDSTRSGEEMTPTKMGANDGKENSPSSSSAQNLSLRRGSRPLSPAASSTPYLWQRRRGPLGGLHAQRRRDGARKDGRQ